MIDPDIGHITPTSTNIISAKNANNATPWFKKKQRETRRESQRVESAAQK